MGRRKRQKAAARGADPPRRSTGAQPAKDGSPPGAACAPGRRRHAALPALVVLAIITAYWNSFGGAFVLDDDQNIVRNERLRDLSDLGAILSVQRPLVELSLALNYAVGKLDPWGYHLVNVIVHALSALLLFGIVRRTLALPPLRDRFGEAGPWLALATSLIWAVHPLQTESVTYVIQRGESMMGLFYLAALYCVIRGASSSRGRWWYACAVVSAGLGMACKAIIITVPAVVLLYDRVFLSGSFVEALRRRWQTYVGVTVAVLVVGFATGIVPKVTRVATTPVDESRLAMGRAETPIEYYVTQPAVVLHYVKLSFWPATLCLDYKWRPGKDVTVIVITTVILLALVAATVWAFLRRPALGFVGAWFLVILAPTCALWKLELAFEHRMYLSLAAVVLFVLLAGYSTLRLAAARWAVPLMARRVVSVLLVGGIALALGVRTAVRNRDYESRLVMNLAVVRDRPNNDRAHYNVANALAREGRTEEAVDAYLRTLAINPEHTDAHVNLGLRYAELGRTDEAIAEFQRALEIKPRHAKAIYNLGNTLFNVAVANQSRGEWGDAQAKFEEAIDAFRRSLQVRPRHLPSLRNLGLALHGAGHVEESVPVLREALEREPEQPRVLRALGDALRQTGEMEEAERMLRESLRIDPNNPWARAMLDRVIAARDAQHSGG